MPMNFPDMKTLQRRAEVHSFRQPRSNEEEANFRIELARHVLQRDRIEAFEIKFGIGWDQWTEEQKIDSLMGTI